MPKKIYKLYCDGACRGNPGPSAIGAVLYNPEGKTIAEISKRIGTATNNEAEYRALIAGIESALPYLSLEKSDKKSAPPPSLAIHLDSQLVVRQIQGRYKVKNARMKPLFEKAKALLAGLPDWSIRHVPREENKVADFLANAAY